MDRSLEYVLRRVMIFVVGILVILTIEFAVLRVMPGDPMRLALPRDPSFSDPTYMQELEDMFGEPLYVQYVEFAHSMLTGDFSSSWVREADVSSFICGYLWNTLAVFTASVLGALLVGSLLGSLLSHFRKHWLRQMASLPPLVLFGIPAVGWAWLLGSLLSPPWSSSSIGGLVVAVASVAGLGVLMLIVRDGSARASGRAPADSRWWPKFIEGVFASMPNMQLCIAMSMSSVVMAEVFFSYRGLGFLFVQAVETYDYFVIQASFFLLAVIVFGVNFALDAVVPLLRPRKAFDEYPGEAVHRAGPPAVQVAAAPAPAAPSGVKAKALKGILGDFVRSPIGVVSLITLLGMAALALIGPDMSSGEFVPPYIFSPSDLFLDGANSLVAITFTVAVIAPVIGIPVGMMIAALRPYADGLIAGVMQGMMAMPAVCLIGLVTFSDRDFQSFYPLNYLVFAQVMLAMAVPPVALLVSRGIVSLRGRLRSEAGMAGARPASAIPLRRSAPALVACSLNGSKYALPMVATAIFTGDFLSLCSTNSWGKSMGLAYNFSMLFTGEWDFVVLPLAGMLLLIGSIFLVLDTLERIVRTRFAHLI